jgi:hypothetical protein
VSVIMMLRVHGDPTLLEQRAQANPEGMRAIIESAKEHGVIAHRFYGSDDGQIIGSLRRREDGADVARDSGGRRRAGR